MFKFFTPKKVMAATSVVATSAFVFNEWIKGPNPEEVKQQAEQVAANAGKRVGFYGASGYGFPVENGNNTVATPTAPTMKFGSSQSE